MGLCTGISRVCESHLQSSGNKFMSSGNYFAGMADDGVGKFFENLTGLIGFSLAASGHSAAADQCQTISNKFADFRGAIGFFREFFAIHSFLTGQTFWQTTDGKWRLVLVDNHTHSPRTISRTKRREEWKYDKKLNSWVSNFKPRSYSVDGKYIEGGDERICHNWMDIAMRILTLIARILTPINWLHNRGAIDLGPHAKGMSGTVTAIWGIVLSINLAQSIDDVIHFFGEKGIDLRRKVWNCFQSAIDLIALPFDMGVGKVNLGLNWGQGGSLAIAILGTVLNLIAALSLILKEWTYYGR
jgi:hypothetical protein